MNVRTKIITLAFVGTVLSITINILCIMLFSDVEPSIWVGAQSLIVTITAGTYSVKNKINRCIGREVDMLGVFGVALGIAAAVAPLCTAHKFISPDGYIYGTITIAGLILLYIDYKRYKNTTIRNFNAESNSHLRETNSEIIITTIIKK